MTLKELKAVVKVADERKPAPKHKELLEMGVNVKVTLRFRGREMAHMQSGKVILDNFAEQLMDVAAIEKPAKLEGKSMMMVLTEKK